MRFVDDGNEVAPSFPMSTTASADSNTLRCDGQLHAGQ